MTAAVRLANDSIGVEVLPAIGARLHRLRVFGHDLLRTPADQREHRRNPFFWGAYHMAPWCNRVDATALAVGPRTVNLASNFPDGSAIHGQVYDVPWSVDGPGTFTVVGGGRGWPWPYGVEVRVELGDRTLRLKQTLTNHADERMPAGVGLHPWFHAPVDLAIHAKSVIPSNTDAASREQPVKGRYDLRRLSRPPTGLDATWTDLADLAAELRWPGLGIRAGLRLESGSRYVVAATPRGVDAIALEPQTHAAHGLRRLLAASKGALMWLAAGESLSLVTELSFRRIEEDGS